MSKRLDGWKLIAAWVNLSMRQVRKLASSRTPVEVRLPVYRLTTSTLGRVSADTSDLDAWRERFKAATTNLRPGPNAAQPAQSLARRGTRRSHG